jgi:hypothetical protein
MGGMEVKLHTFLNLSLPAGEESLPHTGHFTPGKEYMVSTGQVAE